MLKSVGMPIVPYKERLCAILLHRIIKCVLDSYITFLICREGVRVSSAASFFCDGQKWAGERRHGYSIIRAAVMPSFAA